MLGPTIGLGPVVLLGQVGGGEAGSQIRGVPGPDAEDAGHQERIPRRQGGRGGKDRTHGGDCIAAGQAGSAAPCGHEPSEGYGREGRSGGHGGGGEAAEGLVAGEFLAQDGGAAVAGAHGGTCGEDGDHEDAERPALEAAPAVLGGCS